MTIGNEATSSLRFSDVATSLESLLKALSVRHGTSFSSPDYEYRYVGDLFLSSYLWSATSVEGDGLECFAGTGTLGQAEPDPDGSKQELGWCPVILGLVRSPENQQVSVDRALVLFEKDIPADLSIATGLSGTVGDGVVTLTGRWKACAEISTTFAEIESGDHLRDDRISSEAQARLQAGLARLEPYLIADHVLTEGWCSLRADKESDFPLFAFFGYSWACIHPICDADRKPVGGMLFLGDVDI